MRSTKTKKPTSFNCPFCQKAYKIRKVLDKHEQTLHGPAIPKAELKAFSYYFTASNSGMAMDVPAQLAREGKFDAVVRACEGIFADMAQDAYTLEGYGDGENYSDAGADRLFNDCIKEARTWERDAKNAYSRVAWAKIKAGFDRS